ncbi:AarF/UbiB family protein [Bacillus sp. AFS031507]|uniref:AarF/UbiB family protein n=1 Tax=Bacillus sp. AFS031507 TaxID=2033496 RepID=UPI000BFBB7F2|nr:AarF/UbiB family protein [Bacillus sp. AFS031507]PGY14074.1 kinase [Bacillus sp. AFS031507]
MNDFTQIVVTPGKPVQVQANPTDYPIIGKGLQGAVFKLSEDRCVKIYSKQIYCLREKQVLQQTGEKTAILPKVYETGENYIIMEYLTGPSLQEFLEKSKTISEDLTIEIINLIKELRSLQFMRIDFSLRHSIYDKNGKLKIIDHVNSFKIQRSFPKRLFKDLKQLGLLVTFLDHVNNQEPYLYEQWKKSLKIKD